MWPTGLGFDRYYGFLNGETNQWTPNLVRDTNHVEPPREPDDGYHLDADLADNAIAYLRELRISHPDRPFLLWYASAAPHAPHQAPPEWIDRFRGQFDDGWDAWRAATLARQIELGILPEGTQLSERPPWIEEWSTIDAPRRRLYARMMEVCAAFIAHADHHIGRVLDHLDATGELDNTIVVFVSDNGTSGEGGPNGTYNQLGHYISDEPDDIADELAHIDDLGGFRSSGHYPWGWALAGNTPFRRWKRYTFEGGVRDPFILAGPGVDRRRRHARSVLPRHRRAPDRARALRRRAARDAQRHRADELRRREPRPGHRRRGRARGAHRPVLRVLGQPGDVPRRLEGRHRSRQPAHRRRTRADHRQPRLRDRHLGALRHPHRSRPSHTTSPPTNPQRLADLVDRWFAAAERNQVFPLDDGAVQPHRAHARAVDRVPHELPIPRPATRCTRSRGRTSPAASAWSRRSTAPSPTATPAVLCEQGDWISGWAWYLADGDARWCIAGKGGAHTVAAPVPPNTRVLVADGALVDGDLEVALAADGVEIARRNLGVHPPLAWAPDGAFLTVGYARPFPVTDDYAPPAPAPPSLVDVTIQVGPLPPFDLDAELARILRHQ